MKLEGGDGEVCTRTVADYRTLAVRRRHSEEKFSRNIRAGELEEGEWQQKKSPSFQSIEEVTLDKMVSGSYGCLDSRRRSGGETESSGTYEKTSVIYVKGRAIFLL